MKRRIKIRGSVKIVYKKGTPKHFYINGADISDIVHDFSITHNPITNTSVLLFTIPIEIIDMTIETQ